MGVFESSKVCVYALEWTQTLISPDKQNNSLGSLLHAGPLLFIYIPYSLLLLFRSCSPWFYWASVLSSVCQYLGEWMCESCSDSKWCTSSSSLDKRLRCPLFKTSSRSSGSNPQRASISLMNRHLYKSWRVYDWSAFFNVLVFYNLCLLLQTTLSQETLYKCMVNIAHPRKLSLFLVLLIFLPTIFSCILWSLLSRIVTFRFMT